MGRSPYPHRINMVLGVAVAAWAASASPVLGFAVTGVSGEVSPASYSGLCPTTLRFTGRITTDGPGSVVYRWAHVPFVLDERSVVFEGAGTKTVTYDWTVGSGLPEYERWLDLIASSPNLTLETIRFALECKARVVGPPKRPSTQFRPPAPGNYPQLTTPVERP